MKAFKKLSLGLALVAASTQPAFAQQTPALDFVEINKVLDEVLTDLVKGDDLVERVSLKFDEKTNFDVGLSGVELEGKLKSSAWTPDQPVVVGVSLNTRPSSPSPDPVNLAADLAAKVETSTVALVRYGAASMLKSRPTTQSAFDKRLAEIADALTKANSLGDVYNGAVAVKNALVELGDTEQQKWGTNLLLESKSEGQNVTSFSATYKNDETLFDTVVVKEVKLSVTGLKLVLNVNIETVIDRKTVDEIVANLKTSLLAVQQRAPEDLKAISDLAADFLERAKEFVRGDN